MSGNEKIAEFVATTRWTDVPEAARDRLRLALMDNLSATVSGQLAEVSRISAQFAARQHSAARATVLLTGEKAAPALAAFANASAANALDSDDGLQYAYGHAGAQLFPAALAVAESLDLGGDRLLAAMGVGYEVAARVGRCWHDHHSVYQACGSWGSVACAAAAANLMELSPEQTLHALGIAEYFAPNAPMMRDIDHPGMVKHAIGWGAMTGVMAAELAAMGFTGTPGIAGEERYREWVADIGEVWLLTEGIAWKKKGYACCAWAHAAMQGARQVVDANDLRIEEIERIRVEGFHETVRLGTELPATTEEAQFNLAWPVAAVLVDGEVGPKQMLEERLNDPVIRDLARRVEVEEADDLNELYRLIAIGDPTGQFANRVTIVTRDGRSFESGLVDAGLRFPQHGWTDAMVEEKFRHLTAHVLEAERIDRLIALMGQFEVIASLTDVIGLLVPA